MAEKDALSSFDFSKVTGGGLYVKFEAGKPLTLRILTTDPIVTSESFTDKITGEETLQTKFSFIVYNFTDEKAQILSASPAMAKKIGEIHTDPDFGANIKKIDIKISPSGEKLMRRYDIQVLPKAHELNADQIKEAQAIDLDERFKEKGGQRMSFYDVDAAKRKAAPTAAVSAEDYPEDDTPPAEPDTVIEDIGDEPINLDDIPF